MAAKYHLIEHSNELFGMEMMEDDLIKEPLDYRNGMIQVPKNPGWGVKLDKNALDKYATSPPTEIK
jgi:muconate cycloisomerase